MLELPGLLYFLNGGIYTGSYIITKDNIEVRYKIKPCEDKFKIELWNGLYCYEKSLILLEVQFDLNIEGRNELLAFLKEKRSLISK